MCVEHLSIHCEYYANRIVGHDVSLTDAPRPCGRCWKAFRPHMRDPFGSTAVTPPGPSPHPPLRDFGQPERDGIVGPRAWRSRPSRVGGPPWCSQGARAASTSTSFESVTSRTLQDRGGSVRNTGNGGDAGLRAHSR